MRVHPQDFALIIAALDAYAKSAEAVGRRVKTRESIQAYARDCANAQKLASRLRQEALNHAGRHGSYEIMWTEH
jgi:hypothetical protein